jgi:hypothetical protein
MLQALGIGVRRLRDFAPAKQWARDPAQSKLGGDLQ